MIFMVVAIMVYPSGLFCHREIGYYIHRILQISSFRRSRNPLKKTGCRTNSGMTTVRCLIAVVIVYFQNVEVRKRLLFIFYNFFDIFIPPWGFCSFGIRVSVPYIRGLGLRNYWPAYRPCRTDHCQSYVHKNIGLIKI